MGKFIKNPIVEAFQFVEEGDIPDWFRSKLKSGDAWFQGGDKPYFTIQTHSGELRASLNDWIIKELNGECYSCKPDIFEKTYEPVI